MRLTSQVIGPNGEFEYNLAMTPAEYRKVLCGNTLKHPAAMKAFSGTFEIQFKRNSRKTHKKLYG